MSGTWNADTALANGVAGMLGTAAFAGSYSHVVSIVAAHGQRGWVAYSTATSVELMSLAAVTEIRRRSARGESYGWPALVLTVGLLASLAANWLTASPGVVGHAVAVWPAIAFALVAVMVESRATRTDASEPDRAEPARVDVDPYENVPRTEPESRTSQVSGETDAPRTDTAGREPGVRTPVVIPAARAELAPVDRTGADDVPRTDRPSRADVVGEMVSALRTDSAWRPNYPELMARTGYGRSWLEKRWTEARLAYIEQRDAHLVVAERREPLAPIEHVNGHDPAPSVTPEPV